MTERPCLFCSEPITGRTRNAGVTIYLDGRGARRAAHDECLLRSVVGGIGHVLDHDLWCLVVGDPDGGRTYRESALEVAAWIREHGEP